MTNMKSPFLVVQEFISPLQCESIVDSMGFVEPDYDRNDNAISVERYNEKVEHLIHSRLLNMVPDIERHYNVEYAGTKQIKISWFPESWGGTVGFTCENSTYKNKQWIRNAQRDLTAVVFLSDFNAQIPFDSLYEVYGGKYEFPQHNFGFNPQRGTLFVYPSGPHFLNKINPIYAGDLFLAKFHLATKTPYIYQPSDFPGTYVNWFEQIS